MASYMIPSPAAQRVGTVTSPPRTQTLADKINGLQDRGSSGGFLDVLPEYRPARRLTESLPAGRRAPTQPLTIPLHMSSYAGVTGGAGTAATFAPRTISTTIDAPPGTAFPPPSLPTPRHVHTNVIFWVTGRSRHMGQALVRLFASATNPDRMRVWLVGVQDDIQCLRQSYASATHCALTNLGSNAGETTTTTIFLDKLYPLPVDATSATHPLATIDAVLSQPGVGGSAPYIVFWHPGVIPPDDWDYTLHNISAQRLPSSSWILCAPLAVESRHAKSEPTSNQVSLLADQLCFCLHHGSIEPAKGAAVLPGTQSDTTSHVLSLGFAAAPPGIWRRLIGDFRLQFAALPGAAMALSVAAQTAGIPILMLQPMYCEHGIVYAQQRSDQVVTTVLGSVQDDILALRHLWTSPAGAKFCKALGFAWSDDRQQLHPA